MTNTFSKSLQECFIGVGWFNCSYFPWDFCLFICLSGCAGRSEGLALPPCRAASTCLQHRVWGQGQQWETFFQFLQQVLGWRSWHQCGTANTEREVSKKGMTLSTAASKGLTKPSLLFGSFTPWMLLANWWVGITSHLLWAAKRQHTYVVFDFLGFRIPSFQHPSDCAEMTRCGEESDTLLTRAQRGIIFQDQLKQLLAPAGKGKPLWEGAGE